MKKVIAILLLGLLLYNTMGYYVYYTYRQSMARTQLRLFLDSNSLALSQAEVDAKVHNQQWIRFSIPIDLYHQLDHSLEPVEGEFSYQGRIYEKVMRSIQNDTLYLYCVNNRTQEQIQNDLSNHIKTHIADSAGPQTEKTQKHLKFSLTQEYLPLWETLFCFYACNLSSPYPAMTKIDFSSHYLDIASPPPRII
ncbi:hypothetical protein QNI16_33775 [Cytophagaceae bacterium YF14B1]|uniref:Uncharacterized protein n=1 Tax=Xanthocytophaga flava TaxID=3048013 RepID=A0AAE3UD44_9BACT|nr:hypothetical protein [Xanthocytophaga flavus]MDJ1485509.1 hypothetical protein [Xanthocytophaga flavus]